MAIGENSQPVRSPPKLQPRPAGPRGVEVDRVICPSDESMSALLPSRDAGSDDTDGVVCQYFHGFWIDDCPLSPAGRILRPRPACVRNVASGAYLDLLGTREGKD